ncbi:MAG: ribonuclease HI [Candidatus Sungbacteria bacterium RIFCSPLOWO2_02_FULL_51_17]|uniref:Ribonuclease HI n=1 Tax=Candidatus Sungbacteria bacterium RIFCSPHIGHO2_02_FULL_51_29 TaxID=1802273 RepID=A0A1G2KTB1_9BACT|nr:MAG: ribonuclease HI [Candidatus Sungbacteria bacterium RIFCSPHIGHO2_01_FULL_51_22]OHA02464.1 MAG: ribonuclease HI [Candidatus Sungbacteria bacterium RIFCSPHIGHO2_02_FULL_51_29]OHA06740.1 MAG: ribonuclease HI [Candidatus Sungbacteria bacterium RIFCSPLOWO2_01_FULL_51_34]OHA11958.1 MAG: ribonuclease HI [Candidatus Sungbacteria bacterium RIFCSPLOWO2_02_FULL_51_17]
MKKYYAYCIPETKASGICDNWEECRKAVTGVEGARYRGFSTRSDAEHWITAGARYGTKKEMLPGIYFDAGTGRGNGVEVSVTDEVGKDLLSLVLPKKKINKHGKHLLSVGATNNYGELLGCRFALEVAVKKGIKRIYGDSRLVVDYWSKGYVKMEDVMPETIELALETATLRKEFQKRGGTIEHVSGAENPADLGFHR